MNAEINYIKLFFVIFLAVVLGSLTASGIKNWIAFNSISIAMEDFSQEMSNQQKISNANAAKYIEETKIRAEMQRQVNQERSEMARKKTEVGRSLARQCNEWTYANNANSNQYANEQMNKFCNAYNRYLKKGEYPKFQF